MKLLASILLSYLSLQRIACTLEYSSKNTASVSNIVASEPLVLETVDKIKTESVEGRSFGLSSTDEEIDLTVSRLNESAEEVTDASESGYGNSQDMSIEVSQEGSSQGLSDSETDSEEMNLDVTGVEGEAVFVKEEIEEITEGHRKDSSSSFEEIQMSFDEFKSSLVNGRNASNISKYLAEIDGKKIERVSFISLSDDEMLELARQVVSTSAKVFVFHHLKVTSENRALEMLNSVLQKENISLTLEKIEFENIILQNKFLLSLKESAVISLQCSADLSGIYDHLPVTLKYLSFHGINEENLMGILDISNLNLNRLEKIFLDPSNLNIFTTRNATAQFGAIFQWKTMKPLTSLSLLNLLSSTTLNGEVIKSYFRTESCIDLSFIHDENLFNEIMEILTREKSDVMFPNVTSLKMRHLNNFSSKAILKFLLKSCKNLVDVDFSYSNMSDSLCSFLNARKKWENIILWKTSFIYQPLTCDFSSLVVDFLKNISPKRLPRFAQYISTLNTVKSLDFRSEEFEPQSAFLKRKNMMFLLEACNCLYQLQYSKGVKFIHAINHVLDLRHDLDEKFHLRDPSFSLLPFKYRRKSVTDGVLDLTNINFSKYERRVLPDCQEILLTGSIDGDQVINCINVISKIPSLRVVDLRGVDLTNKFNLHLKLLKPNSVVKVSMLKTFRTSSMKKLLSKLALFEELHIDSIDSISIKEITAAFGEKKLKRLDISKLNLRAQSVFIIGWLQVKFKEPRSENIEFRLFSNKGNMQKPNANTESNRVRSSQILSVSNSHLPPRSALIAPPAPIGTAETSIVDTSMISNAEEETFETSMVSNADEETFEVPLTRRKRQRKSIPVPLQPAPALRSPDSIPQVDTEA